MIKYFGRRKRLNTVIRENVPILIRKITFAKPKRKHDFVTFADYQKKNLVHLCESFIAKMCRNKKNNYKMIKIKLSSPFYHAKERHVYTLFFFIHHKNLNQLYIS